MKLLDQFDYLSTVSGGGYIGSWFAAWIRRKEDEPVEPEKNTDHDNSENTNLSDIQEPVCNKQNKDGFDTVCCQLADSIGTEDKDKKRPAMQPDAGPIQHLREYSNYLSPKRGLWSTDTWTLGVTYLRNFILTFSLLFTTLIALVLFTRALVSLYYHSARPTLTSHPAEFIQLLKP